MKFTYITSALLAALAVASPTPAPEDAAADLASGQVTGEAAPQLVSDNAEKRALAKRANVSFIVFESPNCSGGGLVITATSSGTKGDFGVRRSIRIDQLNNNFHLSLYTGRAQSGVITRFGATEVGNDKCFTGNWQSYGLFSN